MRAVIERPQPRTPAWPALAGLALLASLGACGDPGPQSLDDLLPLSDPVELELSTDARSRPDGVTVRGLPAGTLAALQRLELDEEAWRRLLTVHLLPRNSAPDAEIPADSEPISGDTVIGEDALRFLPSTPLMRRRSYVARWTGDPATKAVELRFTPRRSGAAAQTSVVAIYPSSDVLPRNVSTLYIDFSDAMAPGGVAQHVRLVRDENGRPMNLPLPTAEEERWSEDGTRLELPIAELIEAAAARREAPAEEDEEDGQPAGDDRSAPGENAGGDGRDGAADPEEMPEAEAAMADEDAEPGRPFRFRVGRRYRLILDRDWRDAEDRPLRQGEEKLFAIESPDDQGPDPDTWEILPPAAPRAPLVVRFDGPLDLAAALEGLEVLDENRKPVPGAARVSDAETRWTFQADRPWPNGRFFLRVGAGITDPAGNRLVGAPPPNGDGDGENAGGQTTTARLTPFEVRYELVER